MTQADDEVVPLGVEPPEDPPPRPPGRLHGIAITGMAIFALVGVVAMFALATVQWTGSAHGYVIATIVVAVIGFIAFAGAAVLSAARDTYPHRSTGGNPPRG